MIRCLLCELSLVYFLVNIFGANYNSVYGTVQFFKLDLSEYTYLSVTC